MKPSALRPGDAIAVVAPASAPLHPEKLQTGIKHLSDRGYAVHVGRTLYEPYGYLSGTDGERIDEFNRFLNDAAIKALFCARGGYGSLRILPHLDYQAARLHPKLIVGYSDITALHLAFFHKAGWTGLSGSMVAVEWVDPDPKSESLFWEYVERAYAGPVEGPYGEKLQPMRSGLAEGVLVGGNLTLLTRLAGSPFAPDLNGVILFFEEVGEPPYRIDGMLAQLQLAGILDRLAGVVIGAITDWTPEEGKPSLSFDAVLDHYFGEAPYPVARNLVYGHFPIKTPVPVGVRAQLSVTDTEASLTLLEPVVDLNPVDREVQRFF